MSNHLAILQRWEGDDTETLCVQYPKEREEECLNVFNDMKKNAYKRKLPVTYRMIELDGKIEMPNIGKPPSQQPERKIILPFGRFKDAEIYLEEDKTDEEK